MSRTVQWFDSVASTMTLAAELAAQDYPHGTVVGADEQRAGVGRYGRAWHSPKGAGLYFTEILRLPLKPADLPVVTLALGLAAAEAIVRVTDLACDLRWPNDLMIGNRKCAGILVQLHEQAILAGIGINVNHGEFPPELAAIATSLRIAANGREFEREKLLPVLLESIDSHCDLLVREGKDTILRMFSESSSYARGRRVCVDLADRTITGVTDGLDQAGFLLVRTDDGKRETILAGGVRPCS